MCLCSMNVFQRCTAFKLLTSKVIDPQSYQKLAFGEKQVLDEKISNLHVSPIYMFLPSFGEIGKSEVTKLVRGIHNEKHWYFAASSVAS